MSDPPLSDMISKIKWLGSGLPLILKDSGESFDFSRVNPDELIQSVYKTARTVETIEMHKLCSLISSVIYWLDKVVYNWIRLMISRAGWVELTWWSQNCITVRRSTLVHCICSNEINLDSDWSRSSNDLEIDRMALSSLIMTAHPSSSFGHAFTKWYFNCIFSIITNWLLCVQKSILILEQEFEL